jgi:hypothetical protein
MLKVPYDSPLAIVKACLTQKQWHVKHTTGIGPHSCCAVIEFEKLGTTFHYFGNSQIKMNLGFDKYKNRAIKCHGESNAIAAAIESLGSKTDLSVIKKVYVELSPCIARCQALLQNVNPNLEIIYSFDHPNEVKDWKVAAAKLCRSSDEIVYPY